jgi:hypothetical protein
VKTTRLLITFLFLRPIILSLFCSVLNNVIAIFFLVFNLEESEVVNSWLKSCYFLKNIVSNCLYMLQVTLIKLFFNKASKNYFASSTISSSYCLFTLFSHLSFVMLLVTSKTCKL